MDRRDFLKAAGALGAVGGLGGLPLGPALAATVEEGGEASAQALESLATLFADLEESYLVPEWGIRSASDRVTGRFYLMHLLHHGCQFWFEADPERPWFHRWFTPYRKLLGDNPDAVYYGSAIDGARDYRIRGNVNGAVYTSFTVESGSQEGKPSTGLLSTLNDTEFEIAADGGYEVIVSPNPHSGNWLKTGPDASAITTRHYFEWDRSAANDPTLHVPLSIEPVVEPGPAPVMDDAALAAGIQRVINFIRSATIDAQNPLERSSQPSWSSAIPNQFANPESDDGNEAIGYAAKDNVYRMARYQLQPEEALVIRGRFPRCRFANVVLFNRHIQTAPNRYRQVSLNRRQTKLEDDGSFRIIVAHRDPGVPNWLDTAGMPMATIFWRFQLPEEPIVPLRAEVVSLESLSAT
jgi:hypothetical protein